MHMADALVSPAVGGTFWVVTAGLVAHACKRVRTDLDDWKVPLMGVLGAFIFAAQMINFTIPGTGSSGHLGGGLILAILIGPHAAFLVMASVLAVQALFFGDGGLLAFGCNVFNMGVFPCFLAYPLLYRKIAGRHPESRRILFAAIVAALVASQLGALAVVLQTAASGLAELPVGPFLLFMQPIHLAVGLVEGLATAAVVTSVWKARPEVFIREAPSPALGKFSVSKLVWSFLLAAAFTGGILSWFVSSQPDALEWSVTRTTGGDMPTAPEGPVHPSLSHLQKSTIILPDYDFPRSKASLPPETSHGALTPVHAGASLAGLIGGGIVLFLTAGIGLFLKKRRKTP